MKESIILMCGVFLAILTGAFVGSTDWVGLMDSVAVERNTEAIRIKLDPVAFVEVNP